MAAANAVRLGRRAFRAAVVGLAPKIDGTLIIVPERVKF